jgi:hypothetical protein
MAILIVCFECQSLHTRHHLACMCDFCLRNVSIIVGDDLKMLHD